MDGYKNSGSLVTHLEHEIAAPLVDLALVAFDAHHALLDGVTHGLELAARKRAGDLVVRAV